jgi:hypothetical protein
MSQRGNGDAGENQESTCAVQPITLLTSLRACKGKAGSDLAYSKSSCARCVGPPAPWNSAAMSDRLRSVLPGTCTGKPKKQSVLLVLLASHRMRHHASHLTRACCLSCINGASPRKGGEHGNYNRCEALHGTRDDRHRALLCMSCLTVVDRGRHWNKGSEKAVRRQRTSLTNDDAAARCQVSDDLLIAWLEGL